VSGEEGTLVRRMISKGPSGRQDDGLVRLDLRRKRRRIILEYQVAVVKVRPRDDPHRPCRANLTANASVAPPLHVQSVHRKLRTGTVLPVKAQPRPTASDLAQGDGIDLAIETEPRRTVPRRRRRPS